MVHLRQFLLNMHLYLILSVLYNTFRKSFLPKTFWVSSIRRYFLIAKFYKKIFIKCKF